MTELMQMVIDKLGVKVGEEFRLRDVNNHISPSKYYFDDVGKLGSPENVHKYNLEGFFLGLFTGEYQIEKLSFKPEHAEKYYFVNKYGEIGWENWIDYEIDYYRFNAKNCFRTEEEITEEDKKRIVTEMKSKYESE